MVDLAQRFPDLVSQIASGGPGYSTTVIVTEGGQESRTINWDQARHRYNVSNGCKDDRLARVADSFFRKARGRGRSFRFKDWMDYRLAVADSRIVMLTSTTGQICKVYGADEAAFEEVRYLQALVTGTTRLFLAGTEIFSPGGFTVDVNTGIVTYASAPSGARTASCQFDVPCRFDFDEKQAGLVLHRADGSIKVRWDGISIVEVKDE
jgi:uncharacterized protein (TIGR02217 family)